MSALRAGSYRTVLVFLAVVTVVIGTLLVRPVRLARAKNVVADTLRPRAGDVRSALRTERWTEAQAAINQGFEAAQAEGETRWATHFRFLDGLMHQSAARTAPANEVVTRLSLAAKAYGDVLHKELGNGTALNNNAQVHAATASVARDRRDLQHAKALSARADELFLKAIEHGGAKQLQYQLNYAEFLRTWERWRECKALYGELLTRSPDDVVVLEQVADLYRQSRDRQGLVRHLWWLIGAGNAQRAQDVALRFLEDPQALRWLSREGQVELLTVVVTALSSQRYDPAGYAASDAAHRLRRMAMGWLREFRIPVRTIEALHTSDLPHERELRWWSAQSVPPRPEALTPVEAIQRLALRIGDWYRGKARTPGRTPLWPVERKRWTRLAQALYELPVRGRRGEPAPAALERQAALWVDLDRKDKLRALVQRTVSSGTAAPSEGPAAARWQRERFEVHRLLGKAARVAGGGTDPLAVEQLVTAHLSASLDSAKKFNTAQRGVAVLRVSPSVINGLETSLERQGRTTEAVAARVQLAGHYKALGENEAAKTVFQPLEGKDLDALPRSLQSEVKRLQLELKTVKPGATWRVPTLVDPGTTEHVVGVERKPVRVVAIGSGAGKLALFEPERGVSLPRRFDYDALGKVLLEIVTERMSLGSRGGMGRIPASLQRISGGDLLLVEHRKGKGRVRLGFLRPTREIDVPFSVKLTRRESLEDFTWLR